MQALRVLVESWKVIPIKQILTACALLASFAGGYWLADTGPSPDQRAGLVMGFAAVPEADIDLALARLRQVWRPST